MSWTFGSLRLDAPANKDGHYPAEVLERAEVEAIFGRCSTRSRTGIRNRAMLTLLYRSGVRVSELLALKPSDINMTVNSVRVLDGKGRKATTRGFHPAAADALARWLDTRRQLGLRNGTLFCTLDGGKMSDQYVRNLLRRLAAQAGVDKRVHPHALRNTFAFELDQAGTPTTTISKLLGHSSPAVTSRYLDHLTNGEAVAALRTVDLPWLDCEREASR